MESEEKWREQSPGSASHGGGKVCHRCGWVYPNPHPSKKHRAAHRKHCGAEASKPSDDAADVAGAADEKMTPCEQLSNEEPGNKSGEMGVEGSKSEGEEGREMAQSGGEGEELSKNAILEIDNADNSPGSHALHSDKSQISDAKSTTSQLDGSTLFKNHSVACGVDKFCTTEDTESSSHSPSTDDSCWDASNGEMDYATVENVVDSSTGADNTCVGNYVEDKLDSHFTKASIILHDSSGNSSLTDSKIQMIDKYMEFNETADQANAVTTLMYGLPHDVSANAIEPESFIYDAQDGKIDIPGEMSQAQPLCNREQCTLEISAGKNSDTSTHSSVREYLIDKPANSLVNGNEPQDQYTSAASSTLSVETFKVKLGSSEDSRLVEPDFAIICANAEVGSDLDRHLVDVPEVVPSNLLVVESDDFADNGPSNLLVHEGFSRNKEKGNTTETDESNDDHNCRDASSIRSRLVNETECQIDVSTLKSEGTHRESDWLTHEQAASVGSSIDQSTDLDGRVTNLSETCYSSTRIEAHEVDYLSEGRDTNLSDEGTSADNLSIADAAVTVSSVSQFSSTTELSNKNHIVNQEATQVNNDIMVEDKKHDMVKEESSYVYLKLDSQPEGHVIELNPPTRYDIERMELQNNQDLFVLDGVLNSKHEEINSRYLDSSSDHHLDGQDIQEIFEERFKQPASVGKTIDPSERQAETSVEEATVENILSGENYDKVDLPKESKTDKVETIYGSQLELQNISKIRIIDPMSSDKGNPNNPFVKEIDYIPSVEKENSLPNILDKEPNSKKCNEVGLCHDGAEILAAEESSTSKVDVQSFTGKRASDCDSKMNDTPAVAPSISDRSSKEEDVHDKYMQQTDSHFGKIDDSINSNSQTDSNEALWGSVSDGAIPSSRYEAAKFKFDAKASPPTESVIAEDLYTSDLAEGGSLGKSKVDNNNDIVGGPSLTPLVEPGRQSVSIENDSVENSKREPDCRNINEETTAKVLNWNNRKPHVMLKNLLAEANLESEQKATNIVSQKKEQKAANRQGHNASSESKRSCSLHDDEHSPKTSTSKIVSNTSNGPCDNQADHNEWNSPARLPATMHEKKKAKGRQTWVPFICCPSSD